MLIFPKHSPLPLLVSVIPCEMIEDEFALYRTLLAAERAERDALINLLNAEAVMAAAGERDDEETYLLACHRHSTAANTLNAAVDRADAARAALGEMI